MNSPKYPLALDLCYASLLLGFISAAILNALGVSSILLAWVFSVTPFVILFVTSFIVYFIRKSRVQKLRPGFSLNLKRSDYLVLVIRAIAFQAK